MDGPLDTQTVRPRRTPSAADTLNGSDQELAVTAHSAQPEFPDAQTPAAPASDESRWGVLRHKHFRTIWFAAFFSFVGTWFEFVGTQWIIAEKTQSMVWASYLGAAQLLPTFILGLFGGIVADRVNRKKLLMVTQFVMMIIAIGFALVVGSDPPKNTLLAWLLILSLAQGITIAFNNPAWQVLTPRLVPRSELIRAITLQGISFNAARAIGPALAGVIMGFWNPSALFIINAATYIIVMAAVLTTPDAPAVNSEPNWLTKVWGDTKQATNFVFHTKGPRAAFLACVVFGMFATPVLRFLSLFVSNVYHLEEKTFGTLTGVMGAGAVVGGLLMRKVPIWYPRHHFIPLSVFMGGITILLFAFATNVWAAGAIMFFVGWFWMWAFNSSMSSLQMLVDDNMRGRALAVCNTVALGLMPVGYFFASAVGNLGSKAFHHFRPDDPTDLVGLSTQIGVGMCALVLIAAGAIMLIHRTPEVDGFKPGDPGYDRTPGFWRGITASAHRSRVLP